MRFGKASLLVLFLFSLVSLAFSFPGTGGIGAGGGGDGDLKGENPYCRLDPSSYKCNNPPSTWPNPPSCSDGVNNNGLYGKDYSEETWDGDNAFQNSTGHGDPGCVSPFDNTESSSWDTDLTSTIPKSEELNTNSFSPDKNPSILFNGSIRVGNAFTGISANGSDMEFSIPEKITAGGKLLERRIPSPGGELGDGNFSGTGYGGVAPFISSREPVDVSNLPEGSVKVGGRIVDAPVDPDEFPSGTVVGGIANRVTCGDGKYDYEDIDSDLTSGGVLPSNDGSNPDPDVSLPIGDTRKSTVSMKCPEDYGKLMLQPFHFDRPDDFGGDVGEFNSSGGVDSSFTSVYQKENLNVVDDYESVVQTSSCGPSDPPSCSPDYDCSSGDLPEPTADPTLNDYWTVSGDTMTRKKVKDVGYTSTGNGEQCGTDYEWRTVDSINCNDYNFVDGGGVTSPYEINEGIDRPSNDRAGTFTDFTASGADNYPSGTEAVWCHYDSSSTLTVDADGPHGDGDGFVVVKDGDRILGSRSPGQTGSTGEVGKNVYTKTKGGTLSNTGTNFLQTSLSNGEWNLNCPDTSSGRSVNYCVKYLDFYTSSSKTEWNSAATRVEGAVKVDTAYTIRPDQSYSACKFINMVSRNHGNGEALDCDYEASKSGASPEMSPLSVACGDQDSEELVMAEGNQVSFGFLSKELYQSQQCLNFGEDTDASGVLNPADDSVREISRNGCVLGGVGYAEGTVINVTSLGEDAERNEPSPDREVCLNPTASELGTTSVKGDRVPWDNNGNNPSRPDAGGEWYDLDNERVQSYVKANFNSDAYTSDPAVSDYPVKRIETYMRENPNPYHPNYNPTGGETGLVMEDDCGNSRSFPDANNSLECEDLTSNPSLNERFYTFFNRVLIP